MLAVGSFLTTGSVYTDRVPAVDALEFGFISASASGHLAPLQGLFYGDPHVRHPWHTAHIVARRRVLVNLIVSRQRNYPQCY